MSADDTTYLIFGYIKNLKDGKHISADKTIPNVIKTLCALFFGLIQREDYFECYGNQIKIQSNNRAILKNNVRQNSWNTAYGEVILNPIFNKVYIWKFLIKNKKGSICIGINEYDSLLLNTDFSGKSQAKNYSFCGGNGRIYSHKSMLGEQYSTMYWRGDYVYMKLDFSKKTAYGILSYFVIDSEWIESASDDHENKYKIAFDQIPSDTKYKMAVSMDGRAGNCCVHLVKYAERYR